jgi:hypothetical protein
LAVAQHQKFGVSLLFSTSFQFEPLPKVYANVWKLWPRLYVVTPNPHHLELVQCSTLDGHDGVLVDVIDGVQDREIGLFEDHQVESNPE